MFGNVFSDGNLCDNLNSGLGVIRGGSHWHTKISLELFSLASYLNLTQKPHAFNSRFDRSECRCSAY